MKRFLLGVAVVACVSGAWAQSNFISAGQRFHDTGLGKFENILSDEPSHEAGYINGVKYSFHYTDGSGAISGSKVESSLGGGIRSQDWEISCAADPINDLRHCLASRGVFSLFYTKNGGFNISVGTNNYPGSLIWVRVDGGKALSAPEDDGFGQKASNAILKQIKNGTPVVHRYKEWPYDAYVTETSEFYGTQEVMNYMKWAVGRK